MYIVAHKKQGRPVTQCLIAKMTTVLQRVPLVRCLSRQKIIAQFLIGLLESRNVRFSEVAQHLNDAAKPASNENRIQHFFRDVDLPGLHRAGSSVG